MLPDLDVLCDFFNNVGKINWPIADIEQAQVHNRSQFSFSKITLDELSKNLNFTNSSAVGPDDISSRMIKICFPVCKFHILHIFNYSIKIKIFPTEWKNAYIRPIPKVANPKELKDFRPIALTSYLSKLFEKLLSVQMISYVEKNELLDSTQSGYRQFMSTQTALINVIDEAKWAADDRKVTNLVLFDMTKAFDMVDHSILLEKLRNKFKFSIEAVQWTDSYLRERQQAVIGESNKMSKWVQKQIGVPQGTIFGAPFFICYSNDVRKRIKFCKKIFVC